MTEKQLKNIRKRVAAGLFCLAVCFLLSLPMRGMEEEATEKESFLWAELLNREMEKRYFLLPLYLEEGTPAGAHPDVLEQALIRLSPLYAWSRNAKAQEPAQDTTLMELIRQQEGTDEDRKAIEEEALDYGENALHIENSMAEEMRRENEAYRQNSQEEAAGETVIQEEAEETGPAVDTGQSFSVTQSPAYCYDWSKQWNYQELVSNFYAVDASTSLAEEYMDLDELLYRDLSISKNTEGAQILIYHTHSQEAFTDSIPGDPSTTIVGAGERLAELLREQYGFTVLHHTGEYDVENRDYAYSNSLPAIEALLQENPTIEVVIDLHRDEMKEGKKLVLDIQGKPTARFMFFNGMSYSRDKGKIDYLENPYIQENLAFSFQAQVAANEYYPGLARRIYLKAYRYNMHLKPRCMLIELGAQTNTVEEIMNACDPLAHIISIVLEGGV